MATGASPVGRGGIRARAPGSTCESQSNDRIGVRERDEIGYGAPEWRFLEARSDALRKNVIPAKAGIQDLQNSSPLDGFPLSRE